ncbi:MAG TPA: response regulator [Kofleriaceae bacterium]|nr:response regulator [Kofleriaceae bacterium]
MSKVILCADDSATMQKVCEITFRASDFTFIGARSADEALEKAKGQKPALVLADAVMPGKTGYDLCQAIKATPGLADVPVMLLCGKSQAYDSARGAQVGADGHFTKPWDTQMMLDKVAEVLAKAGSEPVARPMAGAPAAAAPPPAPPPSTEAPTARSMPSLATPPAAPPRPAVPSIPVVPSMPQPPSTAARSATIMGMPTIKMPGKKTSEELLAEMKAQTPMAAAAFSTELGPPGAARTPAPPPVAAPPSPTPIAPPTPMAAAPAIAPAAPVGSRQPLVKSAPSRAPSASAAAALAARLPLTAAQVAREAGLDPTAPEVIALVKLSADIVERVVWEVVPEIAENIIRENLDKLTAKAR